MNTILNQLFDYETLSRETAREVLTRLTAGEYNNSQVAAFLTVFLMRTVTVDELAGFRDAMLDLCIKVQLDADDTMDLCGTGGDGKDTFNISTIASFVVAGAGQKVAKHGNYGVSSICGSSNLLDYLGYTFSNDISKLNREIEKSGITFLHAPLFHPAMKHVAPVRKELGVKTFFNMLGPLVNPSRPQKQLTGVFNLELARLYAYLFQKSNVKYGILHSLDGYDEISLTGDFKFIHRHGEALLKAENLRLPALQQEDLFGGTTVADNAKIFMNILNNEATIAQKSAVIANAGMALFVAGKADNYPDAVELAKESLERGNALNAFKQLISGTAS
jgi:anthranilate phosphoribosyltransferase